jgi:flagellar protein FlbD
MGVRKLKNAMYTRSPCPLPPKCHRDNKKYLDYNKEKNGEVNIMIDLTKLDGETFMLNCELIETIEEKPDTIISTTSGKKYIVKESTDEIIDKIVKYKKKIFSILKEI